METGNSVLSSFGTTIFEVMSRLSDANEAINLGQGFPDGNGPPDVVNVAVDYIKNGINQYPPMLGLPALRKAVASCNARFYDLQTDWQTEVLITSGATEALAACLFGLIEPGDEVILLEPLYDSYLPIVLRAGGVPKCVRLKPPNWKLPVEELNNAFNNRTKIFLLNTPMNPCAKVFSLKELQTISRLLQKHNVFAICDEVYEHLIFGSAEHVPLITLPNMQDRCIRIGSAGKTFSLTGWKVGYVTASSHLLSCIKRAHQFLTFTTPPNLQAAVAFGLKKSNDYFCSLASELQCRRDQLALGLEACGMEVLRCEGTYFIIADYEATGFGGNDKEFCRYITEKARVSAIPLSAFYCDEEITKHIRFCFCKDEETIATAILRLKRHFGC